MITGLFCQRTVRGILLLVLCVPLLGAASGCGTGYSDDMTYGLREDALVISVQKAKPPTALDAPGQLALLSQMIATEGGQVLDPAKLNAGSRNKLLSMLDKTFGKPAKPLVANVDEDVTKTLQLDPKQLAQGSALFRRHCLHCHGLTGNGQGPTAPWVNPHPRDYRRGLFKFVSTRGGPNRKPSRQDLLRVLRQGIEGTSMPAFGAISGGVFGVLSDDELNLLASYVIHLSIRGQTEFESMQAIAEQQESGSQVDLDEIVPPKVQEIVDLWMASATEDALNVPVTVKQFAAAELKKLDELGKSPPKDKEALMKELHGVFNALPFSEEETSELLQKLTDDLRKAANAPRLTAEDVTEINRQSKSASIERGYNMFITTACAQCHLDFGRKDNLLWDDWGTIVRPANLTLGTYRGGRRPIDLYWRIQAGIPGANMPANEALTKVTVKKPDGTQVQEDQPWRLWDIVNFVEAVPYRKMLPEKIAETIHPQHQLGSHSAAE